MRKDESKGPYYGPAWYLDFSYKDKDYSFIEGLKDGPWEYYRENGQLDDTGSYKNGNRVGPWEMYFRPAVSPRSSRARLSMSRI